MPVSIVSTLSNVISLMAPIMASKPAPIPANAMPIDVIFFSLNIGLLRIPIAATNSANTIDSVATLDFSLSSGI